MYKIVCTHIPIQVLNLHTHQAFAQHESALRAHPLSPKRMINGNQPIQVRSENVPPTSIIVQTQDTNQSLEMVVNKRVVEFAIHVLDGFSNDAVVGEERKVGSSGFGEGRRMYTETTKVTDDESEDLSSS